MKITVQTQINAPLSKVWQFWTQAEHIMSWNAASPDWHCPAASNDLKAGGKFSFTMASRDGQFSFDFEGVYDEVNQENKIAYTMADGRQASILFEDINNQTRIIETFDAENENSVEMQQAGWQAILDNFKQYVENS